MQLRLLLAITIVHIVAWFAYFGQIPLGLHLGPEEAANIELAGRLSTGITDEAQPITLYQITLSVLSNFAPSEQTLVLLGRSFNALCLILATALCASTAGHFWKRNRAFWITGLCVGLNPVLVFWAGDLSPALPAVACMAAALWRMLRWIKHPTPSDSLWISLALALGGAFQPALLGIALLWPLFAMLYPHHSRSVHFALAVTSPSLLLALLAVSDFSLQVPLQFNITDFPQKIYAFLNSYEAFDGKSYGLHKRLHLPLLLNPIHWGLLLILAIAGSYTRIKNGYKGRSILLALCIFTLFATSCILLDASSRARLAMIPLLAILGGGAACITHIWEHAGNTTKRIIVVGVLAIAGLTYSNFYNVRATNSWEQDYALLARSNLKLGHNEAARNWADKALNLNPSRKDMKSVLVEARFNEWTQLNKPRPIAIETAKADLAVIAAIETDTPMIEIIEGIYHWKLGAAERALPLWQRHAQRIAFARLCLYWTDKAPKPTPAEMERYAKDPHYQLLKAAVETNRSAIDYNEIEKQLDNIFAPAH